MIQSVFSVLVLCVDSHILVGSLTTDSPIRWESLRNDSPRVISSSELWEFEVVRGQVEWKRQRRFSLGFFLIGLVRRDL